MSKHNLTDFSAAAGCGAKIGPGVLERVVSSLPRPAAPELLVGFEGSDDACVWDLGDGRCLVQTVDFFPPMTDDEALFGRVAAANAMSDVWAMGGEPFLALNILAFPTCLELAQVSDILRGGAEKCAEAGVVIAGGHSIEDSGVKYGLCVTGFVPRSRILSNTGARPGDALVLTKALGAGILLTAHRAGLLGEASFQTLAASLTRLNRRAKRAAEGLDVHACTDVTGFSLLGHAAEMARDVTLRLSASALPLFPDAREFAQMGLIPAGAYRNRDYVGDKIHISADIPLWVEDIMFDPQTSGGLLFALPEAEAWALTAALGAPARIIGRVEARGAFSVEVEP